MDQPILHPFVETLRESERLKGFAEAFPAAARVSEPFYGLARRRLPDNCRLGRRRRHDRVT